MRRSVFERWSFINFHLFLSRVQSIKDSKFLYSMMMRINIPCPHVCAHIIYLYGLVNNSESELRFWVCSTWVVLMFHFKSPTFNHNLKTWMYGVTAQLQKIMLRKLIFITYTVVGAQQRTIYRKRLTGRTTSITKFLTHYFTDVAVVFVGYSAPLKLWIK